MGWTVAFRLACHIRKQLFQLCALPWGRTGLATLPPRLTPWFPFLPPRRLLRPANPTGLLINSLLVISQLARSTHAHYDALAGGVKYWGRA